MAKTWELVLYPDNERHQEVIDYLYLNSGTVSDYVGIKHDRDTYTDGEHKDETKKAHYHIVFCLDADTTIGQMQSRFPNIESNLFEKKDNRKESIRYLLHITKNARIQGKTIYQQNELFGNITKASKYLGEDVETNLVMILDYIDCTPRRELTYSKLMRWCIENGCIGTLRKHSFMLNQVIKEKDTKGNQYKADYKQNATIPHSTKLMELALDMKAEV